MCNLTSLQKEAILKSLNQIPIHNLTRFIIDDCFVIDDYIENGLESLKVEEVVLELEYPTKIFYYEEDQEFYDQIENDEKSIQEIQEALLDGRATKEGLLKNTEIDEKLLKRITDYTKQFHPSENNDVPLINGTDIFFFGKSESGKSCVLASIFNYAESKGLFIDNLGSPGMYFNSAVHLLVRELKNGILPDATQASVDAVTYITTSLHMDGEVNPLNFIEMSGEFFSRAAEDPDYWEDSIDAHGYFSNSNKKLLFFIVDYHMYNEGEFSEGTQEQEINLILSQLDVYEKALKNTYCIYIIVNKSDKFPEGITNKNKFAKDFFIDNFKGVYTNLKSKQEKHGFELRSFHFSTGEFILNNSYLNAINSECPRNLIDSISKQAARSRRKGWFSKLFSNPGNPINFLSLY